MIIKKITNKRQAVILLIILVAIGGLVLFGNNRQMKNSNFLMKIYEPNK